MNAMGYENAPATTMLATHCACCAKVLVDAVSVETGVGPECRRKHGFEDAQGEADWPACFGALAGAKSPDVWALLVGVKDDAHKAANIIVHRVAVDQSGGDVPAMVAAIHALGFTKLAARIGQRLGAVSIELDGDSYIVRAPYNPDHVEQMRRVPGRRFERVPGKRGGHDRVPVSSRRALWTALRATFAGALAFGPNGAFTIA